MANIENRIGNLENQQSSSNDLDEFLISIHAWLYPDAPPLVITKPATITLKEFLASCKVLRPKECNEFYDVAEQK